MSARLALTGSDSLLKDELALVIDSEMIANDIAKIFSAEDQINFLKIINSINIIKQKTLSRFFTFLLNYTMLVKR